MDDFDRLDSEYRERCKTPIFCSHANEMPAICPCDDDCYCKEHSCKPQARKRGRVVNNERNVENYGQGFIDGVAGRCLYGNGKQYPGEYLRGYDDGVVVFREAMDKVRVRLKCPLTSQVMG